MTLRHIGILSAILWCAAGVAQAQERGDRAFQQLDTDGDGQISKEEFKQGQDRDAKPQKKRPAEASPKSETKDIEKQSDRKVDKKPGDMKKDRPGPGPGVMAGPKGPGAERMRGRDRENPPRGPMAGERRPGPAAREGYRDHAFGRRDGRPGPMGREPECWYGAARCMEHAGPWAGAPRNARASRDGARGPALRGQGPAAMLDANRDGRIDAVELGRLIDKLQAVRARMGDEGMSLEAFRDHMMGGRGQGWNAPSDRPARPRGDRGPMGDKDTAVKDKPDRERARDGDK